MSDPAMHAAKNRAAEIEARAADWLQRKSFWNWSAENQAALDAWLSESMAHRIAFWRLNAGFSRTGRLAALRPSQTEAAAQRKIFPTFAKFAAAFAVITALGLGGAFYGLQPRDRTYETQIGGHETIAFGDGTRIELNTATVVRTRMTTKERMVWLEKGEAFFQVRHDPAHPFMVMAGNRRITDLGTKFSVRSEGARLEVAVVQGSVRFSRAGSANDLQSAMLTPGDVAVATPSSMMVTKKSVGAIGNQLGWRSGLLVFRHVALAEAVSEFNRYNRTKLVADPAVAATKIYGVFREDNIEDFTSLAQVVLGLHVSRRGNEILITR